MKLDRLFTTVTVEQARELLRTVALQVDSGFTLDEATQVSTDIGQLAADDSLLIEPMVFLAGGTVPFVFDAEAQKDGVLEVTLITASPLTDRLEKHLRGLGPHVPLRVLRAS